MDIGTKRIDSFYKMNENWIHSELKKAKSVNRRLELLANRKRKPFIESDVSALIALGFSPEVFTLKGFPFYLKL